jgi:membrane protein
MADQPTTPAHTGHRPERHRHGGARVQRLRDRYSGSSAEHLVQRIGEMDVVNRGMQFAAVLLLCFFPFLIVLSALAGRSAVDGFSRRLGLNHQAATDVSHLFASSSSTTGAVTGFGYVFFILGGIAAAAALQQLYEHVFELGSRGVKDTHRQLVWLGVLIAAALLASWAGPTLRHDLGPVAFGAIGLAVLTAFWWLTMWVLLGSRVPWRDLLPSALATALFWAGMEIVFSFTFSSTVISDNKKYGAIGVVFALMSWLIAIGVVVILGAIVGAVWRERGLSLRGAARRLAPR